MMHGRPGSALPEDPAERDSLARRLDIDGDLAQTVAKAQDRAHRLYQATLDALLQ